MAAEAKLIAENIRYRPKKYSDFQFEIKEALLNYHILKICVRLGHFELDLYILN